MTCGVCADPPAASAEVKQRAAQAEDLLLGQVEVRDLEVEVKLLRMRAVRPPRRLVVLHTLECEDQTRSRVERREVIIDRPPGIGLVDRATQERLVEPGEFTNIRAVQNHALQLANHRCSFQQPGSRA
jgi:hypothetical protein